MANNPARLQQKWPSNQTQSVSGDLQLPGFVYDAARRRYFRIPHGCGDQAKYFMPASANTSSSVIKEKKSIHCGLASVNQVRRREMNGPSATFEKFSVLFECYRMKMRSGAEILSSENISTRSTTNVYVYHDLIGGGPNDEWVVVNLSYRYGNSLTCYQVMNTANLLERGDFVAEGNSKSLVDMTLKKSAPSLFFMDAISEDYGPKYVYRFRETNLGSERFAPSYYSEKTAMFSVAFTEETTFAAQGYEGGVEIIDWRDEFSPRVLVRFMRKQRFHSLCFGQEGRDLIAGTHRGDLYYMDTRRRRSSLLMNTGAHLLCDLKPWCGDDFRLVCSGYGGYMAAIDLRSHKTICTYNGHVNNGRRTRMSVQGDLISCSGTDGRTRIWSLRNGGNPLYTFDVPAGYDASKPTNSVLLRPKACHERLVLVMANSSNIYVYS